MAGNWASKVLARWCRSFMFPSITWSRNFIDMSHHFHACQYTESSQSVHVIFSARSAVTGNSFEHYVPMQAIIVPERVSEWTRMPTWNYRRVSSRLRLTADDLTVGERLSNAVVASNKPSSGCCHNANIISHRSAATQLDLRNTNPVRTELN